MDDISFSNWLRNDDKIEVLDLKNNIDIFLQYEKDSYYCYYYY